MGLTETGQVKRPALEGDIDRFLLPWLKGCIELEVSVIRVTFTQGVRLPRHGARHNLICRHSMAG